MIIITVFIDHWHTWGFCQASCTMFARCNRRGDRSPLHLWLPLTCDRVRSVSHELNMFSSRDRPCNSRTDYTNWSQPQWSVKWFDTWNVEETLKSRNCKKTTLFCGKRTTKNTEGRHRWTPDVFMHWLHICCTMRANGSFAAIRGNAEFFTCRMRKSDKG